ncbi:MAG: VanZ family protein [Marinobacter sp.]|nr:VanZ family protein [Marinobacter sp.]
MASFRHSINALLQNRTLWRIALLISVLVIIVLATADPKTPLPSTPSDKLNHLLAFVELTLLARLSWPDRSPIVYVPALLAFGMGIELVQANLPYRDFSLMDFATDAIAIGIGLLPWPGIPGLKKTDLGKTPGGM